MPILSMGQSFDLNRRKGGTYFFSQYFDQYQRPLHGTYADIEDSVMITRIFDYGILIKETRQRNGFISHLFIRENSQNPTSSYRIWHNPKQLNELWHFNLDKNDHLRIEISVFLENGFPLIHQNFYPLNAEEHQLYHGITEKEEKIDPLGYTNTWMPIGIYEEWNEKGILTLRKEYRDTIMNVPEEERRKGKYIENYPDGSVKISGQYDDYGHPIDDWYSYHVNGTVAKIISYEYPNSYYLIERMIEFNDNKIKTHEIILDGNGGGETRWNDNGKLSYERKIRNYNWDNKTSWEKWYYENGLLQRYINVDHSKDTVESKYYSNGSDWYIHLEKENVSYQTEYYFNHNKKWEMIQNRDCRESHYNEWGENGDTVKSEITKNNSKQIREFEFGKVVRKYNRDEQGINGDYWELEDNKWIKQFYINGIRQIETHPVLIHYPDAAQTFKKLYTQYSTSPQGVYGYKEVTALDDKDQHHLVEHYIRLQKLFTEKKIEIHQFEVTLGRSTDCSFFVIKSMIGSPVIIIIYDNGYHEFLNRTNDWSSLQLWNEQINFKWN
jgi:hypothetical protein